MDTTETKATSRELAADVVQGVQRLVTLEVTLARQELKELAITNAIAVGAMAAAGTLVMLAVLVALPVAVVVAVPWHWQAAVVWAFAYLVLAGVLYLFGKSRLKVRLPTRTLDSLKETKAWALRRLRSNGR
ncbi:MAG TPA: phage holin family protein [Candidatus Nitrosopolaris sp.]|nr:phage holin family protein [Candidatus Nitrosopolaris sp.]